MNAKMKTLMISVGATAVLGAGNALAGGSEVVTRSVEDARADLMRTYETHGGKPAGQVMSRPASESYADLIRDWDGKLAQQPGTIVGTSSNATPIVTRSVEDAYKDMMRIW